MKRGILIGNGINARLGIQGLAVSDIAKRFERNIYIYSPIIENIFDVKIREDFFEEIKSRLENIGIETLAGILYQYIRNRKKDWSENDEYRLQDIVTCICITSIFFTENGKIKVEFDRRKIPEIKRYNSIYTLNYMEFWDDEHKCIHLHGTFDLSKLEDKKNAILISDERLELKKCADAVSKISKDNSIIVTSFDNVVLAPEGLKKDDLIDVKGLYPAENLYPADDLFLHESKKLYEELNDIDELDVFGMSPYGDDSIIAKINSKSKVRIFVYEKDKNLETLEWRKKLTCQYEILDSLEI